MDANTPTIIISDFSGLTISIKVDSNSLLFIDIYVITTSMISNVKNMHLYEFDRYFNVMDFVSIIKFRRTIFSGSLSFSWVALLN